MHPSWRKARPALKLTFLTGDMPWDCRLLRAWRYPQALPANASLFGSVPPEKKKLCRTPSDSLKSVLDTLDTLQMQAASFAIAKQRFAPLIMSWKHCYGSKALKKKPPRNLNRVWSLPMPKLPLKLSLKHDVNHRNLSQNWWAAGFWGAVLLGTLIFPDCHCTQQHQRFTVCQWTLKITGSFLLLSY